MSTPPSLVRVGVVGSGGMAEYHVKKFSALPAVVVAACADRSAGHARWLLHDVWGKWEVTPRWRWRVAGATSTGGVIGDLGSHLIDSIRFILGEIESVSCATTCFTPDPEAAGPGAPDSCAAMFRMKSGFLASMRASWRARGHLDSFAFQVEGEQGSIAADLVESRDRLRLFDPVTGAWSIQAAPPVRSTYEHFVDEIRGRGGEGPGFAEGVEVQRVIESCLLSSASGRVVGCRTF